MFLRCHGQGQAIADRFRDIEEQTEKDIVNWTYRQLDIIILELDEDFAIRGGGGGGTSSGGGMSLGGREPDSAAKAVSTLMLD